MKIRSHVAYMAFRVVYICGVPGISLDLKLGRLSRVSMAYSALLIRWHVSFLPATMLLHTSGVYNL